VIKFTKEERAVLLFLLAALFAGSAVMYYKKVSPLPAETFEFKESKKEYSKKININKAAKEELTLIKGVGPALAGRIISYREKNGDFKKAEEIKNIRGIGEKTFEKIKKQITLE